MSAMLLNNLYYTSILPISQITTFDQKKGVFTSPL